MPTRFLQTLFAIFLYVLSLTLLASCSDQGKIPQKSESAARLSGIWDLKSRITDENEAPVTQRFIRLALKNDGTFRADYRGEANQKWVKAGQGAFSYSPPILTMHWESGAVSALLVRDSQPDRMVLHHGRNMTPLAEQDPDEVFVRINPEKGPTRNPN